MLKKILLTVLVLVGLNTSSQRVQASEIISNIGDVIEATQKVIALVKPIALPIFKHCKKKIHQSKVYKKYKRAFLKKVKFLGKSQNDTNNALSGKNYVNLLRIADLERKNQKLQQELFKASFKKKQAVAFNMNGFRIVVRVKTTNL